MGDLGLEILVLMLVFRRPREGVYEGLQDEGAGLGSCLKGNIGVSSAETSEKNEIY